MPLGPFTSINPLANAIDIKVEGLAAQVGMKVCVFWISFKAHGVVLSVWCCHSQVKLVANSAGLQRSHCN